MLSGSDIPANVENRSWEQENSGDTDFLKTEYYDN